MPRTMRGAPARERAGPFRGVRAGPFRGVRADDPRGLVAGPDADEREEAPRVPDPLRAVEPALRREAPRCVVVLRVMRGLSCEKACVRWRHPWTPKP